MGITTIKRKIAAIALVCVLAIIVLFSALSQTVAFAESDDEQPRQTICITNHQDDLPYSYDSLVYYQYDQFGQTLYESLPVYYNCNVIIDVKSRLWFDGIYHDAYGGDAQFLEQMKWFFNCATRICRVLKENECNVMVILDTDENRLPDAPYDYRGFLDYVDVYVNTDMLTLFMDNFLREMIEKYEVGFSNGTYIVGIEYTLAIDLDGNFANYQCLLRMCDFLVRRIQELYGLEFNIALIVQSEWILNAVCLPNNVSYIAQDMLYMLDNSTTDFVMLHYEYTEPTVIDLYGYTYSGYYIYMRNCDGDSGDVHYASSPYYENRANWLGDIVDEFDYSGSYSGNNWTAVNGMGMYKPMAVGEDGWMTSIQFAFLFYIDFSGCYIPADFLC